MTDSLELVDFTKEWKSQITFRRGAILKFFRSTFNALIYVIFLILAVLALFVAIERMAKFALSNSFFSDIYPNDFSMVRKDSIHPATHYDYDFAPGACIEYNVLKGNRYEYANNAGFRDPRKISTEKPDNEFRIFFTGGSTAFGLGPIGEATSAMNHYSIEFRETIAHYMEMILNAVPLVKGKTIKVYNTAVWGHAFQHLLIRYPVKLRNYKPDMVISLDGANELPLVSKLDANWNYFYEGQYNGILREIFSYSAPGLSSYLTLWLKNNTYLMSYLWAGRDVFQEMNVRTMSHNRVADLTSVAGVSNQNSNPNFKLNTDLLDRNIAAVVKTVEDYSALLTNDGVPHILALQPWFYLSKKPLNEKEKIINEIQGHRKYYGIPSDRVYRRLIDKLVDSSKKRGYFLVDFSQYFDDVTEWAFTDWCHLTAGANYLIAKELSNLVKQHFFGRSLGPGDFIGNKDAFFWDLVAGAVVIKAPMALDSRSGPENFQRGYPGDMMYDSVKLHPGDKAEIVIDLKQIYPVSRLRIVWGDEQATPEEWVVEVSTDSKEWTTFCSGSSRMTDNYSRWPGYEYYGSNPENARYVRYRQTKMVNPVIKLRVWNLFR
ncbi:MAG: discoidin domain-containing protein [Desulfomonilaceae bacterium]